MPDMMKCCVKQPKECHAVIIYDGVIYNWTVVDMPDAGPLCFCPEHKETAKKAQGLVEYLARLEAARIAYWKERHGR